jgi:photosystem II stability/assembly factor-like uncharacterized protein
MVFRLCTALPILALVACGGGGGGGGGGSSPRVPPAPPAGAPQPGPAPAVVEPPRQVGPATLTPQVSGTTARLQAVSVVNERIVWASGTGGTFVLTTNGGTTWLTAKVAEADSLEFRDIHAVDAKTAYLLSAGPGTKSRIYKTTDGGVNWQIQFVNRDPEAFYDCFAFWDRHSGLAFSDNVRGRFPLIKTTDGGLHWDDLTTAPPATKGEGAFAASGTCVTTLGNRSAWIATGAGEQSRVLFTPDRGGSWQSWIVPAGHGTATTGLTSIAFRTPRDGIAAGGDVGAADAPANVIITRDGGVNWTAGSPPTFPGAVYGVVYIPGGTQVVAVGPKGASWSPDEGRAWQQLDTLAYWSVGFASRKAGWLVGPGGRITKVSF